MPRPLYSIAPMLLFAASLFSQAHAADLFGVAADTGLKPKELAPPGLVLGGYPMYQGGMQWRLLSKREDANNLRLKLGHAEFISSHDNAFFAQMSVMVNLSQANAFFLGEPCARPRLVRVNKGGGRYDNCLWIDPYVSSSASDLGLLRLAIRNSQMGSRIYELDLLVNVAPLGFAGTTAQDWTAEAVAADGSKKQLLDKLSAWGQQLQDGVNKAIGYDKPQDAFSAVPPLTDLLPAKAASAVAQR